MARTGRIAVSCGVKGSCGYISRNPDKDGVFCVTPNPEEALHAQLESTEGEQLMEIRLLVRDFHLISFYD